MQSGNTATDSIIETKSFAEISANIQDGDWLLLDIDRTLMDTPTLGGDAWFSALVKHASSIPINSEDAIASIVAIYHEVQHHVEAVITEEEVANIVRMQQERGTVRVLAVTARDICLKDPTERQLKSIGIDFSHHAFDTLDGPVVNKEEKVCDYYHGIIYCSGADKGICFEAFARDHKHQPQSIVAADDKKGHLVALKRGADALGAKYRGFRYGNLDDKPFDLNATHLQLAALAPSLSTNTHVHIRRLSTMQVLPSIIGVSMFNRGVAEGGEMPVSRQEHRFGN